MMINFLKHLSFAVIILVIFLGLQFITIPMMTGKLIGIGGFRGRGNLYWSDSEKIISLKKKIPTEHWNQYTEASIKTGIILEFVLIVICLVTLFYIHKTKKNYLRRRD
jgi:hypothetical protein